MDRSSSRDYPFPNNHLTGSPKDSDGFGFSNDSNNEGFCRSKSISIVTSPNHTSAHPIPRSPPLDFWHRSQLQSFVSRRTTKRRSSLCYSESFTEETTSEELGNCSTQCSSSFIINVSYQDYDGRQQTYETLSKLSSINPLQVIPYYNSDNSTHSPTNSISTLFTRKPFEIDNNISKLQTNLRPSITLCSRCRIKALNSDTLQDISNSPTSSFSHQSYDQKMPSNSPLSPSNSRRLSSMSIVSTFSTASASHSPRARSHSISPGPFSPLNHRPAGSSNLPSPIIGPPKHSHRRKSSLSSSHRCSLLGSYEESLLSGRMSIPSSPPIKFSMKLTVSSLNPTDTLKQKPGSSAGSENSQYKFLFPKQLNILFDAVFYDYDLYETGNVGKGSPYVANIDLEAYYMKQFHDNGKLEKGINTVEENLNKDSQSFEISNQDNDNNTASTKSQQANNSHSKKRNKEKQSPTASLPFPGYRIPEKGQVQIIISSPDKLPVRAYLIPYDASFLKIKEKTFIRQLVYLKSDEDYYVTKTGSSNGSTSELATPTKSNRTSSKPHEKRENDQESCTEQVEESKRQKKSTRKKTLAYAVHLQIARVSKSKYYLYGDLRLVFQNRMDTSFDGLGSFNNSILGSAMTKAVTTQSTHTTDKDKILNRSSSDANNTLKAWNKSEDGTDNLKYNERKKNRLCEEFITETIDGSKSPLKYDLYSLYVHYYNDFKPVTTKSCCDDEHDVKHENRTTTSSVTTTCTKLSSSFESDPFANRCDWCEEQMPSSSIEPDDVISHTATGDSALYDEDYMPLIPYVHKNTRSISTGSVESIASKLDTNSISEPLHSRTSISESNNESIPFKSQCSTTTSTAVKTKANLAKLLTLKQSAKESLTNNTETVTLAHDNPSSSLLSSSPPEFQIKNKQELTKRVMKDLKAISKRQYDYGPPSGLL